MPGLQAILAGPQDSLPLADRVLTNIFDIWTVPQSDRARPHRIQTEVVIYYFDAAWNSALGECAGQPTWLPIPDCPVRLKAGQRVALEGIIVPLRERFSWDQTKTRVVDENVPLTYAPVADPGKGAAELTGRLVSLEGLLDFHSADATHLKLSIISGSTLLTAWVMHGTNLPPPHLTNGNLVRVKGVYAPQLDRDKNLMSLALWVNSVADITTIGTLADDPRFTLPITPTDQLPEKPATELVHVEGMVRSHDPGNSLMIWDATGQVVVETKQRQVLHFGDHVEAIGHPYFVGLQQGLRGGLFRLADAARQTNYSRLAPPENSPLRLVEMVRSLTPQDANRHLPVALRAVVTWSHPLATFAYVQDASGGIKILNPRWERDNATLPGTVVMVEGVTAEGQFVPVVTNAVLRPVSWWNLEPGRMVPLSEALTGVEDGRWIEMRGFVRSITRTNNTTRFDLGAPGGEFHAWTYDGENVDHLKGAIIHVQGVCAAISNDRHQLTGVEIWSPDLKYIHVEEAALMDVFSIPARPLGDLRRFSLHNTLNQRVRTSGTVILHARGRYLYLQDGPDALFALSQQPDLVPPGDRVEVVGFPDNDGKRLVLREAVFRRQSTGADPAPFAVSATDLVAADLEGHLVTTEGRLLNTVEKNGETRLLLKDGGSLFEVGIDTISAAAGTELPALPIGSRLAVTGVYQVQNDEYGKPETFTLRLRSGNDVRLLERPSWWTSTRLLWTLLAALVLSLVALGWGVLISRKNALLHRAQAELNASHASLEVRVRERTQDLARSLSLLNATLEATVDGILVVDRHGTIVSYNARFATMWRLSGELMASKDDARLLAWVLDQLKDGEAFLARVKDLYAHPDKESFDVLDFKDGRVFERYSQPQRLEGACVGRVWCFRDVTARKQAEAALERAHKELVDISHQAGMAEVATGVLHNVGNVLNSVNVSASLVSERLRRIPAQSLTRVSAMLEARDGDLGEFLTHDAKGKLLPTYIKELSRALLEEQQQLQTELESLVRNVEHIKVIVAMQQSYATVGGAIEPADPAELMDDAVAINAAAFERRHVRLVRDYQPVPRVLADRHKVLQILTNLLRNARHALDCVPEDQRQVTLTIGVLPSGNVCFKVRDNGIGIEPQNLTRIFTLGFTTKEDGHGFGLHNGANAAREMKGSLRVQSDGPGRGAEFTLELPSASNSLPSAPFEDSTGSS